MSSETQEDLNADDVLYDKGLDDRVAEARSWDEIKMVTKEYLNKLQLENTDKTEMMDMMKAFDEDHQQPVKKQADLQMGPIEDVEEPDLVAESDLVPFPKLIALAFERIQGSDFETLEFVM